MRGDGYAPAGPQPAAAHQNAGSGVATPASAAPPWRRWAAAVCLLAFGALCAHGLWRDSPTVDEFAHLPAGLHYLKTGSFALFAVNPPLIKVLCALPLLALQPELNTTVRVRHNLWFPYQFGTDFMERNRQRYDELFSWGRVPVVVLGLLLGGLVYLWASEQYGSAAGLLALFLYSFCPSVVAHAHLATVDLGHAFFFLLAIFLAQRFITRPSLARLAAAGLALGLAQLTKLTALILYPLLAVMATVALLRGWRFAFGHRPTASGAVWSSIGAFALLGAISVATLNAGYLMQGTGARLGTFQLQSHALRQLVELLPPALPVPLPVPFVYGLDGLQLTNELGENPNYLFGQWSQRGWHSYYLVALLFKTPLPFLALLSIAVLCRPRHRAAEAWVWLPALALLGWFSLFSRVQYGIRYVLPVLPLACVYAGRLVPWLASAPALRGRVARAAVAALLVGYPVSVLIATPNTIDYFNLLAGKHPDDILIDSNLDWGQGLERLRSFRDRRGIDRIGLAYFGHVDPAIYGIAASWPRRDDPQPPEYVAASVNFLRGYPYVTYRDGGMALVTAGEVAWIGELPLVEDLGGGLRVFRRVPQAATATTAARAP